MCAFIFSNQMKASFEYAGLSKSSLFTDFEKGETM